jgi:hypothetical protein
LIVADLIRDWDIQVVSQRGRAEVPDGAAEGAGAPCRVLLGLVSAGKIVELSNSISEREMARWRNAPSSIRCYSVFLRSALLELVERFSGLI